MEHVKTIYQDVKSIQKRSLLQQILNLFLVVCTAVIIWKSLCIVSGSKSPVVVVLSGSMEPAFIEVIFYFYGLKKKNLKLVNCSISNRR